MRPMLDPADDPQNGYNFKVNIELSFPAEKEQEITQEDLDEIRILLSWWWSKPYAAEKRNGKIIVKIELDQDETAEYGRISKLARAIKEKIK